MVKKIAALSVVIVVLSGIGIATGILPSPFFADGADQAVRECVNCGVVEAIRIGKLSGQPTEAGEPALVKTGNDARRQDSRFLITVRMSNGERQTLVQQDAPPVPGGRKG